MHITPGDQIGILPNFFKPGSREIFFFSECPEFIRVEVGIASRANLFRIHTPYVGNILIIVFSVCSLDFNIVLLK